MELLKAIVDVFLHLDAHLADVIATYGGWTYAILFCVIFCETGFVVTPFLPGDSLLFASGALAAAGALHIEVVYPLLICASVCGDSVNYTIGRKVGARILKRDSRIIRKEYVAKTQQFYDKYGAKTMVIARFVPFVRTFAPFMAGVGKMPVRKFAFYIVLGAFCWVTTFVGAGYGFAQNELVRKHFGLVVIAIIIISTIPAVVEFLRQKYRKSEPVQQHPVEK